MRATAAAVTRSGGFRPGTWAVVITTSMPGDVAVELVLLGRLLFGRQLRVRSRPRRSRRRPT